VNSYRDHAMTEPGAASEDTKSVLKLDLRGIKCPLNWAHAKVRLETMRRGEVLELLIDDPRGARDIPRAAEAEGYSIVEMGEIGSTWRLRIEK
jgi:TusA-related sulfurtransferase